MTEVIGNLRRTYLPLPTKFLFTAVIGNFVSVLTESELEDVFVRLQDKPEGFGYIEFADFQGPKHVLEKSGSNLASRVIHVRVAEPQSFCGSYGRELPPPSVSGTGSNWRASSRRPLQSSIASSFECEAGEPSLRSTFREGPIFSTDTKDRWAFSGKYKPSVSEGPGSRFSSMRGCGDMELSWNVPNPPKRTTAQAPHDCFLSSRYVASNSTPSTPQMGRWKLELLPRSSGSSAVPSPLASPNSSAAAPSTHKLNLFSVAKPVDISGREAAIEERLEKEQEQFKERASHSMSRTSSRTASQRRWDHPGTPASPTSDTHKSPVMLAANVRPLFSFASAAAGKKDAAGDSTAENGTHEETEKIEEVKI
ncbi:uncharacterized protein LAESUDRAFT_719230 [Laetiporus sulphureus 93-53]|uniref:RRM domain-containing protein n=1 Tax=Laetiporus sulphureus 93-53 TaxID=1314785 RepID=A0A165IDK5_9APHY|nr:uncharacterized protein LAESUDRAFT_719230 [Laetiporus sulphureus 93-53]KZT12934.1 hypothetical protein LAESUDRAFT_719230 [Laetiporus sulphureus 93-53]